MPVAVKQVYQYKPDGFHCWGLVGITWDDEQDEDDGDGGDNGGDDNHFRRF